MAERIDAGEVSWCRLTYKWVPTDRNCAPVRNDVVRRLVQEGIAVRGSGRLLYSHPYVLTDRGREVIANG